MEEEAGDFAAQKGVVDKQLLQLSAGNESYGARIAELEQHIAFLEGELSENRKNATITGNEHERTRAQIAMAESAVAAYNGQVSELRLLNSHLNDNLKKVREELEGYKRDLYTRTQEKMAVIASADMIGRKLRRRGARTGS